MESSRITVADIARECGVSVMTVSRALRNGNVQGETRKRILEAAERLGYHKRNKFGRPAGTTSAGRRYVEVIIGSAARKTFIFHAEILTAIEQELAGMEYDCVVRTCTNDYQQSIQLLKNLQNSDADATIVIGDFDVNQLISLFDLAPDALLLDNPGSPQLTIPYASFCFDNIEAARLATAHLIEHGRRRIILLRGPHGHFFADEIEQGYRMTLRQHNLTVDEALILECDYTIDGAEQVVATALKNGLQFDALFANDEMAIGAIKALNAAKRQIPSDVAICGCDDIPISAHLTPALTTVELDYRKLAQLAVAHIFSENRRIFTECKVRLCPKLKIRASS